MFNHIGRSAADPIMSLMEAYLRDENTQKVNLGIGLYYDQQGRIPLMQAVEAAELQLLEQRRPHGYPPIEGSALFAQQVQTLLFGEAASASISTVQTVGGSGALKLAADFIHHYLSRHDIWVSDPTWANHWAIFEGAGLKVHTYPYFDEANGGLRFDAMLDTLDSLPEGSVVLLHPCCHNPTGTDLSPAQWRATLEVVQRRRLLPLFDIAYQGFGDGLDEDCFALREALKTDLEFFGRQFVFEKRRAVWPAAGWAFGPLRQPGECEQRQGCVENLDPPQLFLPADSRQPDCGNAVGGCQLAPAVGKRTGRHASTYQTDASNPG
ncbi:Tyrosine aminotransferase [Serratia quinivorans]|uniref:Tyrosine aminotransferase n=1 Tax=Serratia quinivorans TaxID=137545 RepID=A0A380AMU2_9GAMM|nr:Tyrosine aminotransferase [Serratia quinivorans]